MTKNKVSLKQYLQCLLFILDAEISTESLEVQKIIVDKHNNLRKAVTPASSNMLIMQWSNEVASNAKEWAITCSFNHSPSFKRKISKPNSWEDVIQAWLDENFTYAVGAKNGEAVGRYTQTLTTSTFMFANTVLLEIIKVYCCSL
ncbi:cysteine-rich secretory protein 2-like [Polypterus senegalus]|uniref:cysteine-rich secretory protein 2-like n=1 Tax=Polypterus senegalus TaxID=55291 RepID=UPI001964B473|nr:cysteine-rich secretory protein 2-like [Polypterus senegalus]